MADQDPKQQPAREQQPISENESETELADEQLDQVAGGSWSWGVSNTD